MKRFAVIAPADLSAAARMLAEPNRSALAGGVDLLDLLKQELAAPDELVNLKALGGLDRIESESGGALRIGPLVTLHQLAASPAVRARHPALADAAAEAATPQLRNLATVGGNLAQRPRCWYFRNPAIVCLKKGGSKCYAVAGLNRYHAILGGGPSFIVNPSNLAPALVAYDATLTLHGPDGARKLAIAEFFTLPKADPRRENALIPGEIIAAIDVPAPPAGARSAYIEAREKQSFDWPLASAVAILAMNRAGEIEYARIVMGAVAPIPWRAPSAEKILHGARLDRAVADRAAQAALEGAAPLAHNAYKIPIARAMVRRAILRAGGIADETA